MLEGMKDLLQDLQETVTTETIDTTDLTCPLWQGIHTLHLISYDAVTTKAGKKGYTFTFANSKGEPMPSDNPQKVGGIWKYKDQVPGFLVSLKQALHMPAGYQAEQILEELEKPHDIYLTINHKMQENGLSFYNTINFVETFNRNM